jgi:hypothetical protein
MEMLAFWVITAFGLSDRYQRFGGIYYVYLQGVNTFTDVRTSFHNDCLFLSPPYIILHDPILNGASVVQTSQAHSSPMLLLSYLGWLVSSLLYNAFSVTRHYNVDDRVISE